MSLNEGSNYVPGWTKKSLNLRSLADSFWHRSSVSAVDRPLPTTAANIAAFPVTWLTATLLTPHFRLSTRGRRRLWHHRPSPTSGTVGKTVDELRRCLMHCIRNTIPANMASQPEVTSEV